SLPDDLLLTCFARVSRLYYPTLSLVSKSFRTILASPELGKTRALLNRTETCLYVCLKFRHDPNQRWFTLCRKPNQTLTNVTDKKKNSSGYVLVPIPIPSSPPAHYDGLVAVGSNIYAIGGSVRKEFSSRVSILDCRSHTWHEAPSMSIKRNYPTANVVDGRIYVAGGIKDFNSSNWMEVFDTKTQTWEHVLSPLAKRCGRHIYNSTVIEGKLYVSGFKGVAYKPKEDKWIPIRERMNIELALLDPHSYCAIDNVQYYYRPGQITWTTWYDYDELRDWIELKGLEGLPKIDRSSTVKLADCGGKLVVLWDKYVPASGDKEKMIWCAEISLERRNSEEIWGKVEWFDEVLTVPKYYKFVHAISATV
ncbi:unnamed protein product, partial [Arabidopsis halleri]